MNLGARSKELRRLIVRKTEFDEKGHIGPALSLVEMLSDLNGLVAYSLFQLTENEDRRQSIYHNVLQQTKSLHFAVEGLHTNTAHEPERIDTLWRIRQTLPNCMSVEV